MKQYTYKEHLANLLPCTLLGVLCGALTGAVIFGFRVAAAFIERLSRNLYGAHGGRWWYIAAVFGVLTAAAVAMYFLQKWAPESRGGGIPRSTGVLRGRLPMRRVRTLIATVLGSLISFFCGVPVGAEGPSVLIGTALGGCLAGQRSAWSRYVMTGGAGAGFAIATGAPFAGILFSLEEIHKRFTPMLVITVSVSVLSAAYCNGLLCTAFGVDPRMLVTGDLPDFSLSHVGYLLLLALIIAGAVALFDFIVAAIGRLTKRFGRSLPAPVRLIITFLASGLVVLLCSDGAYSGHHTIEAVLGGHEPAWFLLVLLAVRLAMMALVTDSGATGGIFVPTLALGVLSAGLAGRLLLVIGMPAALYTPVVLLGMCAFIGGTLRAPLTATVLFIELTGQFTHLFYVAVVVFAVNAAAELLNQTPFYDHALEAMERAQNGDRQPTIAHFRVRISSGSFVVGKAIRDVLWPSSSVVIGIIRAHEDREDMDNDGEKKLYVGDTLVVRARYYDEAALCSQLEGLVGTDYAIETVEV